MGENLAGEVTEVVARLNEPVDDLEHRPSVVNGDGVGQLELHVGLRGADQRRHRFLGDLAPSQHGPLIQQRQGVPHGAFGLAGQGFGGRTGQHQSLLLGNPLEVIGQCVC